MSGYSRQMVTDTPYVRRLESPGFEPQPAKQHPGTGINPCIGIK